MDQAVKLPNEKLLALSERDLEEAFAALHRSISASQIYPPNHPMLRETLKHGYRAWRRVEDDSRWESPGLQLRTHALWFGEKRIGQGSPALSSLVRTLEGQGVVNLRRTGPLTPEGYESLVRVLTTAPEVLASQGGILAVWKGQPSASCLEIKQLQVSAATGETKGGPAAQREGQWGAGLGPGQEISALADPLLLSRLQSFQQRGPKERRVLDLLLRLSRAEDITIFLDLLREISRMIEDYLDAERYREAFHVTLYLYREAQNMDALGKAGKRDYLLETVRLVLRGGFLVWLVGEVASGKGNEEEEAGEYILRYIGTGAVVPLINALVAERSRIGRRRLVDVLVSIGEPVVPWALKMLEDQRWFVVRNMVTVLGGIGSPEGLKALVKLSRDSDNRIRKEVARVLANPAWIEGDEAEEHLIHLLRDPDMTVRLTALSATANSKSSRIQEALWGVFGAIRIWSKQWELLPPLLRTIGRMGIEEAVPRLARVAARKRILWRKRGEEVQRAAVQALALLPPAGTTALRGLSDHRNPEIRREVLRLVGTTETQPGARPL